MNSKTARTAHQHLVLLHLGRLFCLTVGVYRRSSLVVTTFFRIRDGIRFREVHDFDAGVCV